MEKEKAQEIPTRVLREAARLFSRYGYATTSIDLVVRELRLSTYPHDLDDLETLAKAAFEYGVERSDRQLDDAVSPHQGAVNRLAGLICGFRELVEHPPPEGGCPVFSFSPGVVGALPFVRSSAQQAVNRWRHRIRRLVRTGIKHGDIYPGVDPEEVSSVFLSTLEGAAVMYLLYEDATHLDRAQQHLCAYLSRIAS